MKIDILGSFKSVNSKQIKETVKQLAQNLSVPDSSLIEIVSVSNIEIKTLNKQFRNKDEITDVLSFPISQNTLSKENIFGSIVIAEEYSLNNNERVLELIKHGFLHLAGYDHENCKESWREAAKKVNHQKL